MKVEKYYLVFAVVAGILCVPALGEIEVPRWDKPKPVLLDRPNPVLAGIEELYVLIVPPDAEPNKDGLVWKDLDGRVQLRLREAGIKIRPVHITGGKRHEPVGFKFPELRVHINMLRLADSRQYVYYIQTSLASKVSLLKKPQRYIKADVWKLEPVMEAVSGRDMPPEVTKVVLEQVEAFVNCYLVANPNDVQPADTNDLSVTPKEQPGPAGEPTAAKYNCVASKKSKVFHSSDCRWAGRISPENLVGYNSREEATEAGKRPCKRCKP